MPLQPHAQQQVDEQVSLLARAFKAGFKAALMEGYNIHVAKPDYRDFVRFLEGYDIVLANYVKRELFDQAE